MDILKKHKNTLRKYKVKRLGLFGSYVRGVQKEDSDIDIFVEFDLTVFGSNYSGYFDNYVRLLSSLKRILGRNIDIVTAEMISPYIKLYILKDVRYLEEI